jgi:hypothetical protein
MIVTPASRAAVSSISKNGASNIKQSGVASKWIREVTSLLGRTGTLACLLRRGSAETIELIVAAALAAAS